MSHRRSGKTAVSRCLLRSLAVAAAAGAYCEESRAAVPVYSWIGGSGTWSNGANWSSATVPIPDSAVFITHNDSANRLITFDSDYTTPLRTFTLDQTGAGATTLSMSTGTFGTNGSSYLDEAYIGYNGRATFVQTGGVNVSGFYGEVHMGELPGSAGTYAFSGGTLSPAQMQIGVQGAGTYIQNGGTTSLGYAIDIGIQATGSGTLNLNAGSIGTDFCYVGNGGTGLFNQTGGTHRSQQLFLGYFYGIGTYALSNGTLNVPIQLVVGQYGDIGGHGRGIYSQTGGVATVQQLQMGLYTTAEGTVAISGGSMTVSDYAELGFGTLSTATVTVSNAGSLHILGDLDIGRWGRGNFTIGPTGSFSMDGYLNLATQASGAGTFTSNGISFSTIADDVGVLGNGTFIQNGGTRITTRLILGDDTTGTGTYILNSGIYAVTNEYIGGLGTGIFNQNGGRNLVSNVLTLSDGAGFGCEYNLSGGTLSAVQMLNRYGTFTQTGGVATFTNGITGFGTIDVSGTGKLYVQRVDQYALNVGTGGYIGNSPGAGNVSYLRVLAGVAGEWDLNDGALVVNYGPIPLTSATMRAYIGSAFAGGSWTGNGLTSSAAAAQATAVHRTALGYAQATDLFSALPAFWDGVVVNSETMLVRYTWAGDANLDGVVDIRDLRSLATHWHASGDWSGGDFDYNGFVDTGDLNAMVRNWQMGVAPLPGGAIDAPSPVPEPGGVIWWAPITLGLCMGLRDRRRRAFSCRRDMVHFTGLPIVRALDPAAGDLLAVDQ